MAESSTSAFAIFLIIANIVTGTINTITIKAQNRMKLTSYEDDENFKGYNHPYFQSMNMFIGEMCCIFVYFYLYRKQVREHGTELTEEEKKAVSKGLKLKFSPFWFSIPACFDFLASTMLYIALVIVDAGVVQIIACSTLIWVGIFSFIFLKRRYTVQQYLGMGILLVGVSIVAVSSTLLREGATSQNHPFGIFIMILAVVFVGLLMVSEEMLLKVYYAHPLQIVGIEGATGLAMYCVLLFAFYFIRCNPDDDISFCPYGRLEDTPRAVMMLGMNPLLLITAVGTIGSLAFFNYFGVSLTKYASATHRGVINAIRPFSVWMISITLEWEQFKISVLIGYLIAVIGMLLYYGVIPLFGEKKSNPKEEVEKEIEENALTAG